MLSFMEKHQCELNARESGIKEDLKQNDDISSVAFKAISKIFGVINYLYIDFHHMMYQAKFK